MKKKNRFYIKRFKLALSDSGLTIIISKKQFKIKEMMFLIINNNNDIIDT